MTLLELAAWHTRYDSATYSPQVYAKLVVEGKEHPEKFNSMGAWKKGCLRKGIIHKKTGKKSVSLLPLITNHKAITP